MKRECMTCKATGFAGFDPCSDCLGSGYIGEDYGECLEADDTAWIWLRALSEADKAELRREGWIAPHATRWISCASGCSHCAVCDYGCNADWGLYM